MDARLLLLDSVAGLPRTRSLLQPAVDELGIELQTAHDAEEAMAHLLPHTDAGRGAALLVVGPHVERPVATARRVLREAPGIHLLFLANGAAEALHRELASPVAMIGTRWSVVDLGTGDVADRVRSALRAAERSTRLRTTLSRMNERLATQPAAGLSELQRFTTSHRFLANILEHAHDAIAATTLEGIVVAWNGAAERMLAVSRDDAMGRPIFEIGGAEWRTALRPLVKEARSSTTPTGTDLSFSSPDGRARHADVVVSQVLGEPGRPVGLSVIVRDVTDRRELEQRLEQARRFERLGVLAGGVAHDFNNILTSIQGHAELAALSLPPEASAEEYLTPIQSSAKEAAALCRQMLAFAGGGRHRPESVDVDEVVDGTTHLIRVTVGDGVDVRYELRGDLPPVRADPVNLRQLLLNLVANAAEAIGEAGGTVTVSTGLVGPERAAALPLVGAALGDRRHVSLEVSDDGAGMDARTLEHAFDPFFTTKFVGRGLGLPEVLGIARKHGGAVGLTSHPGEGTVVHVLLPPIAEE